MKSQTITSNFLEDQTQYGEPVMAMPPVNTYRQEMAGFVSLKKIGAKFMRWLCGSQEPKIYKRRDRQGHVYYKIYNPTTDRYNMMGSELEVRIWLESRYHQ